MKIRVTNTYGDRESVPHHTVDDALIPPDIDDMWEYLWTYTGDGSGENEHAYYEVEILDSPNPALIGLGNEWC
jgi:hypothetical protein